MIVPAAELAEEEPRRVLCLGLLAGKKAQRRGVPGRAAGPAVAPPGFFPAASPAPQDCPHAGSGNGLLPETAGLGSRTRPRLEPGLEPGGGLSGSREAGENPLLCGLGTANTQGLPARAASRSEPGKRSPFRGHSGTITGAAMLPLPRVVTTVEFGAFLKLAVAKRTQQPGSCQVRLLSTLQTGNSHPRPFARAVPAALNALPAPPLVRPFSDFKSQRALAPHRNLTCPLSHQQFHGFACDGVLNGSLFSYHCSGVAVTNDHNLGGLTQ